LVLINISTFHFNSSKNLYGLQCSFRKSVFYLCSKKKVCIYLFFCVRTVVYTIIFKLFIRVSCLMEIILCTFTFILSPLRFTRITYFSFAYKLFFFCWEDPHVFFLGGGSSSMNLNTSVFFVCLSIFLKLFWCDFENWKSQTNSYGSVLFFGKVVWMCTKIS